MISALSIDHLLTSEQSREADELLFHYTSRESLRAILNSGNLRLNTLDNTNDPRERSEWIADRVVLPPGDVSVRSLAEQDVVLDQIDEVLRRGARVACLTADRPRNGDAAPDSYFHRGWGRARMWEQYGEKHKGAVLAFDRVSLIEALDTARAVGDGDVFAVSAVSYLDRPLQVPLEGWFDSVASIREALDGVTSKGTAVRDLFFVKNSDWSGESEFRVVVVLGAESGAAQRGVPLDLPYRDSLRAVVLGERWDGADWLRDSTRSRSVDANDVVRCAWVNGAPVLRPYTLR